MMLLPSGIKLNSFSGPDNEFLRVGRESTSFTRVTILIIKNMPTIMRMLDIQLVGKTIRFFFYLMVLNNIEKSEKEHIYRPDMINILMQVQKGNIDYKNETDEFGNFDGFSTVEE